MTVDRSAIEDAWETYQDLCLRTLARPQLLESAPFQRRLSRAHRRFARLFLALEDGA